MSASGSIESDVGNRPALRRIADNVAASMALLIRKPDRSRRLCWPSTGRMISGAVLLIAMLAAVMIWLDYPANAFARQLPYSLVYGFDVVTDFGKSIYFLLPIGLMLVALTLLSVRPLPKFARLTLTAWSVRLGFLFIAIGLPSLAGSVVKHMIGRARPFEDGDGVFTFKPFVWDFAHASMPSGHGTTAFAAAVAIGTVWPWTRPVMFAYAVIIGLSRVALTSHHPSDIIASALFGAIGAMLVRNWFAARRLGFAIGRDGIVCRLPGPSWRRTKAVARRLFSTQS